MVITRSVLSEIIKDEYEKLLTEAVEEAAIAEEGQLEEQGMSGGEKVLALAVIATVLGLMAKTATDTEAMAAKAAELRKINYDREELNAQFKEKFGRFLIGATPGMGTQRPFMIDAAAAALIGNEIEWDGKTAPRVKGTQAPTSGPAKPAVPSAAKITSPKGGVKIREGEFPRPKTAAPKA